MWMSIMILCASMNAQSCMVITGNELHTSKEKCFKSAIEKANKAVTYPQVHQAKPFCQVIPGTEQPDKMEI
tara:strand:+ start:287 stop:499 length:213 start_codon:yes stop_codon:yes gene_type:complete